VPLGGPQGPFCESCGAKHDLFQITISSQGLGPGHSSRMYSTSRASVTIASLLAELGVQRKRSWRPLHPATTAGGLQSHSNPVQALLTTRRLLGGVGLLAPATPPTPSSAPQTAALHSRRSTSSPPCSEKAWPSAPGCRPRLQASPPPAPALPRRRPGEARPGSERPAPPTPPPLLPAAQRPRCRLLQRLPCRARCRTHAGCRRPPLRRPPGAGCRPPLPLRVPAAAALG
jgi:hypothetical protein